MKIYSLPVVLLLLLSTVAVQHAKAGDNILWTADGVPVCTVADNQWTLQITHDDAGGAIIVWEDDRNASRDIYAQRVDANGDTLWSLDGVGVCTEGHHQYYPQVTADGSGGTIITWEDFRNTLDYDVYAQRVDASGDTTWSADGIPIADTSGNQVKVQLVGDGFGGAIIAWQDYRSGGTYDIYAQRVNAGGGALWGNKGRPICIAANQQQDLQIVADGFGGAIIAWRDYRSGNSNVYAQRVDANGDTLWTADGVAVCTYTNNQQDVQLVSDGTGGAIITWEDWRGGSYSDIYAQRVAANGNILWPSACMPVCTATDYQWDPQIVADGAGGALITWQDWRKGGESDIYSQRISPNGNVLWQADGVPICTASLDQEDFRMVTDGSGGAIITWWDERGGYGDIYAQRVSTYGDTLMPADGELICSAPYAQYEPRITTDGSKGAIITWQDWRNGSTGNVYAQRVHFNPAAHITSIGDVPDDQGRQVTIIWDRSYMDDPWYKVITEYSIWRKYPAGTKIEFMGQLWDGSLPKNHTQRMYRLIDEKGPSGKMEAKAWEYIGSMLANYFESYAYIAPTLEDSSASGTPYFSFLVTAHTHDPFVHWDSAPDSGYSVDNIDPSKTQVTAIASGGAKGAVSTIWLAWTQVTTGEDGSPERGPIQYRIYCDEDPGFAPGPGNLLTETPDLSYPHTDVRIGDPAANLFYLVTVIDGGGNESATSNLVGEFDRSLTEVK